MRGPQSFTLLHFMLEIEANAKYAYFKVVHNEWMKNACASFVCPKLAFISSVVLFVSSLFWFFFFIFYLLPLSGEQLRCCCTVNKVTLTTGSGQVSSCIEPDQEQWRIPDRIVTSNSIIQLQFVEMSIKETSTTTQQPYIKLI